MMHPLLSCLLDQFQNTVRQGHFGVGRNHVNVVWLQGHSVLGFPNRQSGGSRQKATQNALVSGVKVLNQHKSHALSAGRCCNNSVKASSPPAEAPMPTMGNNLAGCARAELLRAGAGLRESLEPELPARGSGLLFRAATGAGLSFLIKSQRLSSNSGVIPKRGL